MASNYNDSTIVSMEFTQHIRSKPGMYSFQLNNIQGLTQQLKEVVDNSVDEALDPKKVYPINITFFVAKDKSTYQCIIQDHGRGIPVNTLGRCFTHYATSGKYEGQYGGTSSGTFGIGSKGSAALSKIFIAFTKRDDGFGYLRLEKGVTKQFTPTSKRVDKNADTIGTTVFLQPDDTLFTRINEMFKDKITGGDTTGIQRYLESLELYSIFKPNVDITVRVVDGLLKLKDLDRDPVDLWKFMIDFEKFGGNVVFRSNRGETPRSYVQRKFSIGELVWELGELHKVSTGNDDPLSYDIDVFTDDKTIRGSGGGIVAAVNATPIVHPESSHIYILQQVIKDHLIDAIEDAEKKAYFENKYKLPLSGYISVGWLGAEFIGQDKSRFENRQFEVCYRQFLRKAFKKISEESNNVIWDRLWELIQEHFEIEYSKFSRTTYKTGGDIKNLCYDLKRQNSFFNCKLKNGPLVKTELFITEGDSAAGRVKSERNTATQAVLKLSGKPKNGIRDDGVKLKTNLVYADLCRILGVNRSDTNLDNLRFDKIIILTDADADGYHIVALVIGLLYRINPLILSEGHVYISNPPLYSILQGSNVAYLRDISALDEARRIAYRALFDIDVKISGGKVVHLNKNPDIFRDICMITDLIGSTVTRHAELLNIPPMVLEQLVHCVDFLAENKVDCKSIKETLLAKDVVWDKSNEVVVLIYETDNRSIEYRIPLTRLQKTIRDDILPVYERFHWKDLELFITTKHSDIFVEEPCTFTMLYDLFTKISDPTHGLLRARRFKGLGEMSPSAIKYTCIDPQTRCFTNIRGLGDVGVIFKMLGVDTDERKKLVNSGLVEEVTS